MITTYNYPGASSFRCVWHTNSKADKEKARIWWRKIHEANGPCAPGGSARLTDKEARTTRYRDGTRVYNQVRNFDGDYVQV